MAADFHGAPRDPQKILLRDELQRDRRGNEMQRRSCEENGVARREKNGGRMKTKEIIENMRICYNGKCDKCTMVMKSDCIDDLLRVSAEKLWKNEVEINIISGARLRH